MTDANTLVMLMLPPRPRRQKILKEKAVPMIEGYMFEEHEMLRRAATECMCNLAMSKEVRAGPGGHARQACRSTRPSWALPPLTWSLPASGRRCRTSLKPRATTG